MGYNFAMDYNFVMVYKYPSLTLIKSSQEKSLNDETSVILREEQEENWVMVKQCRGRGDGIEYSLYPS
ncbi:uncharacterized protein OCT59_009135 [Rhizophagus irregularis]|uniref:uncharacterized protein n=1 Tax=Rhizophagus irregularis TaxID=588596 RepID=UPI0019E3C455|nr:hypothetical protein OCT59_009135 [Rhizophagus irregularis]GET59317.1 hypothetical protein GLOIN_2v1657893 [Rhizophagus irregularis DAOM 181602=DAOM 197198]CAB4475125.1 unnamed protein product [Rhizophagus irregularis]CAB5326842.1 unnamed protein product [Rhizophagus irregularis]